MRGRYLAVAALVTCGGVMIGTSSAATPTRATGPSDFQLPAPAPVATTLTPNCVISVTPVPANQTSEKSKASPERCYPTLQDAIYDATNGSTLLDPSITPARLTPDMLTPAAPSGPGPAPATPATTPIVPYTTYVTGYDYSDAYFGGSTLTFERSSQCSSSVSYVGNYSGAWNNVISSSQAGYSNCNVFTHYDYYGSGANGGAYIRCTCQTMGAMNDASSSYYLHHE